MGQACFAAPATTEGAALHPPLAKTEAFALGFPVSLLKLERRAEDTYDDEVEATQLGGYAPNIEILEAAVNVWQPDTLAPLETESGALAEPITRELLDNLRIPAQYHQRLLAIQTEEEFTNCIDVPQEYMTQVLDCIYPPSISQVMQQPVFIVEDLDDLLRYKEGELLGFLLKLSPEQERFVSWAMRATGPTQVFIDRKTPFAGCCRASHPFHHLYQCPHSLFRAAVAAIAGR